MRGRKKTTGRYGTREELCSEVWRRYRNTPSSMADIARACRVSEGTVAKILNGKEGMPAWTENQP
jgi:DNA transposition AAA+ family ATPase